MSEIWPNFFIVGAPKAGTTSLYQYLLQLPGVFMPSRKEPHYFSAADYFPEWIAGNPIRDKQEYLRLFRDSGDAVAIGEASTSYLAVPHAPENIYQQVPDGRIIIMLRDPVERLYSGYWMRFRLGAVDMDFDAYASSLLAENRQSELPAYQLAAGLYSKPVARYLQLFGEQNVKIVWFEEFVRQPDRIVKEVATFLGIRAQPRPGQIHHQYNSFGLARGPVAQWIMRGNVLVDCMKRYAPAKMKRFIRHTVLVKKAEKPPMPEQTRRRLRTFYAEDEASLERLLNRALPWRSLNPSN